MSKKVERKFLMRGGAWRTLANGTMYRQEHLTATWNARFEFEPQIHKRFSPSKVSQSEPPRSEYEYETPFEDGKWSCRETSDEKRRYRIRSENVTWEVNEFLGDNAGLIIAEVELASEDQIPEVPSWVGYEVTEDPRYINANLAKMPFTRWSYRAPNFGVLEHGVIKTVQEKMWGLRPYWGRPGRCR